MSSDQFKQHLDQQRGRLGRGNQRLLRKEQIEIDSHLQNFLF